MGMNGNQMVLLAWWELAAVVGLVILAKVILPVYYRYDCTTTTEFRKRYDDRRIRALIGLLFLLGNLFIFIPAMLYGGSLFIQIMFNVGSRCCGLPYLASWVCVCCARWAARRVSDAYSGVLLLTLGVVVVLCTIGYRLDSRASSERLTLIGDNNSRFLGILC